MDMLVCFSASSISLATSSIVPIFWILAPHIHRMICIDISWVVGMQLELASVGCIVGVDRLSVPYLLVSGSVVGMVLLYNMIAGGLAFYIITTLLLGL